MNYTIDYLQAGSDAVFHTLTTNYLQKIREIIEENWENISVYSIKHGDIIYWKRNRIVLDNQIEGMWKDHRTKDFHTKNN